MLVVGDHPIGIQGRHNTIGLNIHRVVLKINLAVTSLIN